MEQACAVLGDAQDGLRLDKALVDVFAKSLELTRSRAKALLLDGHVTLDGVVVTEPKRAVSRGQTLVLALPPATPARPEAQDIPISIVFEDEHLVVVDKPVGLTVHPGAGQPDGTLVNALLHHCGTGLSGIGGVARPGIVHRLDKDTSGLLVVAKSDRAHKGLSEQFAAHGRDGRMERSYLALAWGDIGRVRTIDAPLARSPHHRTRMAVARPGREGQSGARHAVTHVQAEARLASGLVTQVACTLETGRTHQIRVHLAHIGHPLLGDTTYGAGMATKAVRLPDAARQALLSLKAQALHARTLGFVHPVTEAAMRFEAPPPEPLARLIATMTRM